MADDELSSARAELATAQINGDVRSIGFYERMISGLTVAPPTPEAAAVTVDPLAGMMRTARVALGSALRDALKVKGLDAAWAAALDGQSQNTRDWWASGYRDLIPEDAVKLRRIAAACKPTVDLKLLYDATLSV